MDDKNILLWVLLAAGLFACCWWYMRENFQAARLWRKRFDEKTARGIIRFTYLRSLQMLGIITCLILLILMYDWKLSEARATIDSLNAALTAARQAAATPAPATAAKSYYPPATNAAPAPPETAAPVILTKNDNAKLADIVSPGDTVEDIYNPEKSGGDKQSGMDDLKKRYEEILVTYMFLKKCGIASPQDYHIITSALGQEMASINAPGRLQYDILTAAQGSYKEMYSQNSCDAKGIDALQTQYADYIKVLSSNFAVQ